jgi:hypothetical protein
VTFRINNQRIVPEDELALGERVSSVNIVAMVEVEALFRAESLPKATQLDGKRPFMAN